VQKRLNGSRSPVRAEWGVAIPERRGGVAVDAAVCHITLAPCRVSYDIILLILCLLQELYDALEACRWTTFTYTF